MKKQEREVINPHDKIFIDFSDVEAAQVAVLLVGRGAYGIEGDDGLPLFLFGGVEEWVIQKYNKKFEDWVNDVSKKRLKKSLLSMRLDGKRSSLSNPVKTAHDIAKRLT